MRIGRDLLVVALIFFVWTALLEAALHLAGLKIEGSLYMQDRTRVFRLRPSARAWYNEEGEMFVVVNSRGFRDRERVPGPHPGVFRVAVVGDSGVAGLQVRESETFTEVAGNLLGPHVEVLNFGIPDYSLTQQFLTLRDEVLKYQPDLVVEAVNLTNSILNSTPETSIKDWPYPYFSERGGRLELNDPPQSHWLSPASESALLDAENHSDLALLFLRSQRVVTSVAEIWERRLHLRPALPEHYYDRTLAPSNDPFLAKSWRTAELTLAAMRDLCADRGIPFWILTMDVSAQTEPDALKRARYFRSLGATDPFYADSRFIRFAQAQKIPSIQSAPILADYVSRTHEYVHGFFNTPHNYGHLNVTGDAVLGRLLADRLRPVISAAAP